MSLSNDLYNGDDKPSLRCMVMKLQCIWVEKDETVEVACRYGGTFQISTKDEIGLLYDSCAAFLLRLLSGESPQ